MTCLGAGMKVGARCVRHFTTPGVCSQVSSVERAHNFIASARGAPNIGEDDASARTAIRLRRYLLELGLGMGSAMQQGHGFAQQSDDGATSRGRLDIHLRCQTQTRRTPLSPSRDSSPSCARASAPSTQLPPLWPIAGSRRWTRHEAPANVESSRSLLGSVDRAPRVGKAGQ